MWFIGVEVETSAPPPKKNPGSAPVVDCTRSVICFRTVLNAHPQHGTILICTMLSYSVLHSAHATVQTSERC